MRAPRHSILRNRSLICGLVAVALLAWPSRHGAVTSARDSAGVGGSLPNPLFPADNWWNQDVSRAPVDPRSASFISFVGSTRRLHPDFGGFADASGAAIYGFPYVLVSGDQPKRPVDFYYWRESDGVDRATGRGVPFYPIPDEAITTPAWIEGGEPGSVDQRDEADRHMLIVDVDNRHLYELYNVYFDGARWQAGSGAFFDLKRSDRRPDGWTSADAAGLAILPGLVRYDEVFGPDEIRHAFRVTVRATNGYVYPASHRAGSNPSALPMGARLRLKASKNLSAFRPELQKIFRAMQRYGLIVADNGSDMYISGAFDPRWNNDILNPAFRSLNAGDFEVVELGWRGGDPSGGEDGGGTGTDGGSGDDGGGNPGAPSCEPPGAPGGLGFQKLGFFVSLGWMPPSSGGAVQTYVVDAGSVPGANDLLSVATGAALGAVGVAPPGRYYVRVKARNPCGTSGASNEVVVTLP
jgi:hypothetical protein